jgi:hypothetical protein
MFMHAVAQLIFGFLMVGLFVCCIVGAITIYEHWRDVRRDKRIFKNVNKFRQDFK